MKSQALDQVEDSRPGRGIIGTRRSKVLLNVFAFLAFVSLFSLPWGRQVIFFASREQRIETHAVHQNDSLCANNTQQEPRQAALCEVLASQYVTTSKPSPVTSALEDLHYALETMQTNYFALGLGTWPSSIDWTAAIFSTFMSASLGSLTRSLEFILPPPQENPAEIQGQTRRPSLLAVKGLQVENEINKYFSQSIAYYFGENAWEIRFEAYDDMLWVVLGWLENIRFIRLHTSFHFPEGPEDEGKWYGEQFTPGFAHRARVFYDLAKRGWDTRLCGGGMVWNPRLLPYKNAITNQLFISASINMYLHYPGDNNTSPFLAGSDSQTSSKMAFPAHNPVYLRSAVDAYNWLKNSNMTNDLGLYVDGFHIHNYGHDGGIGTGKCDDRNEMLYTYNQGVILSGLRGLWESTNQRHYLEDGHTLIRNVIAATGWNLSATKPPRDDDDDRRRWAGLGRGGILEELCDISGRCSQDAQTFKGIFFHHFTLFCAPLPTKPLIPGVSFGADKATASLHAQSCREYAAWVAHNAIAAMSTRDEKGRFGMWWGASRWRLSGYHNLDDILPRKATDYRNTKHEYLTKSDPATRYVSRESMHDPWPDRKEEMARTGRMRWDDVDYDPPVPKWSNFIQDQSAVVVSDDQFLVDDFNDRGRGRTVETQGGGLAVVRAMWEIVQMFRRGDDNDD